MFLEEHEENAKLFWFHNIHNLLWATQSLWPSLDIFPPAHNVAQNASRSDRADANCTSRPVISLACNLIPSSHSQRDLFLPPFSLAQLISIEQCIVLAAILFDWQGPIWNSFSKQRIAFSPLLSCAEQKSPFDHRACTNRIVNVN
jgi:hypothetical protein